MAEFLGKLSIAESMDSIYKNNYVNILVNILEQKFSCKNVYKSLIKIIH